MALEDFYGPWSVYLTSKTPFGFGTPIMVGVDDKNRPVVWLDGQAYETAYDDEADQLSVTGIKGIDQLVMAHYADPDESESYVALYGVGLLTDSGIPGKLAVFTAVSLAESAADAVPRSAASGRTASSVSGKYLISSTSGSQFGAGSVIELDADASSPDGASALTITNVFQSQIPSPDSLYPTGSGNALVGMVEDEDVPRTVVQCSFVELGGLNRIFGLGVVGDPENSGTWGGDEEEDPGGEGPDQA